MGYQLIYNSSFKDIDENTINIEIYKDSGGTLIASELLCSADAVSINYESDDDVFKPIKCSDCQINVLTTKVLANLYTALGNQIYCTISKNGYCGVVIQSPVFTVRIIMKNIICYPCSSMIFFHLLVTITTPI
mgnify:CR=1 FL=1